MMLTQEYLKSIISYNLGTGIFVWIKARKRVVVGARAGTIDKDGYRIICIDQKNYRCGRLAVFYVTGSWPTGEVDHRNLIKDDDAWANLRPATHEENGQNKRVRRDSSTGHKCIQRDGKLYYVRVIRDGARVAEGRFPILSEAIAFRDAAIIKHHGDFARAA